MGANCVNDIMFYVPSTLFDCLREALSQAKEDNMPTGNLHWLSRCPALVRHVWLEYNMTHPSNTSKTANPRYRITRRPLDSTPVLVGKFHETLFRSQPDYEYQHQQWLEKNGHKNEVWSDCVSLLLRERNPCINVGL